MTPRVHSPKIAEIPRNHIKSRAGVRVPTTIFFLKKNVTRSATPHPPRVECRGVRRGVPPVPPPRLPWPRASPVQRHRPGGALRAGAAPQPGWWARRRSDGPGLTRAWGLFFLKKKVGPQGVGWGGGGPPDPLPPGAPPKGLVGSLQGFGHFFSPIWRGGLKIILKPNLTLKKKVDHPDPPVLKPGTMFSFSRFPKFHSSLEIHSLFDRHLQPYLNTFCQSDQFRPLHSHRGLIIHPPPHRCLILTVSLCSGASLGSDRFRSMVSSFSSVMGILLLVHPQIFCGLGHAILKCHPTGVTVVFVATPKSGFSPHLSCDPQ